VRRAQGFQWNEKRGSSAVELLFFLLKRPTFTKWPPLLGFGLFSKLQESTAKAPVLPCAGIGFGFWVLLFFFVSVL
jgi:hypothetical protein